MALSPELQQLFDQQIQRIYWQYKIATTTTEVAAGTQVTEIEVLELRLHVPNVDVRLLRQIERAIPYHLIFLFVYQGKYQAWIGYKATSQSPQRTSVANYYHTDWLEADQLVLTLEGETLDAVYEHFVRQIAGETLKSDEQEESLQEAVARIKRQQQLRQQIASLQRKIRREKQFNKQVTMNNELRKLIKELEALTHGKNEHGISESM